MLNEIGKHSTIGVLLNDIAEARRFVPPTRKLPFRPATLKPKFVPASQDRGFVPATRKPEGSSGVKLAPAPNFGGAVVLAQAGVVLEVTGDSLRVGTVIDVRV